MQKTWIRLILAPAVMSIAVCGCANISDRATPKLGSAEHANNEFQVRMSMARLHERQGELAKARMMYEQLLSQKPDSAEIHHRLMVIYTRLDQPALATQEFDLARGLNPNNADLFADRGYALYLAGELEQAETLLKQAYQLDSQNERIVINLATVTGAMGRIDESWSLFRRVLDDAEAHANVGFVLMQRGELGLAKKHYSIALDLDPKSSAAKNALVQIAQWEQKQRTAKPRVVKATPEPEQTATARVELASAQVVASPQPSPEATPWFGSTHVTLEPSPPVVPARIGVPQQDAGEHSAETRWQLPTAVNHGQ